MTLPQKELYTISEVANRWNVPNKTIEDYLLTDKLRASVLLPKTLLLYFCLSLDLKNEDDVNYIKTRGSYETTIQQGIFCLANYQDIKWDEHKQCKIEPVKLCLSLPEIEGYFGFTEYFVLSYNNVLITLAELFHFEREYGIDVNVIEQIMPPQVQSNQESFVCSIEESTLFEKSISQNKPPKTSDLIDPRRETTLLTLIGVLLEVISGDFPGGDIVKHPSIKDQTTLINKLINLEIKVLSKRNLEKIFPEAKRAVESI